MKKLKFAAFAVLTALIAPAAFAGAKVMNPGEAKGQLVFLTEADVLNETPKYKSLSFLSIPVFGELPMDMTVVAGAITLKQQNLLSHVQIKSRARRTPNLDISGLPGGMSNELFRGFKDGDYIYMALEKDGRIFIGPSTEAEALEFYEKKKPVEVHLKSDMAARDITRHENMSWEDYVRVGSKAANYAELAKVLNTADRTVVRPGYAIPFYYYQEFLDLNPEIKSAIARILRDPMMKRATRVAYREEKLKALQEMILSKDNIVSQALVDELLARFDQIRGPDGNLRKIKLRSSTNAEDLPNFNGAGLYTSESYKPLKKGKEKSRQDKEESLKEALRVVWASIWNLRAFDERTYFQISHEEVKMGVQVNFSFSTEDVDGVLVTKNIAEREDLPGKGVYMELQRGDKFSVANPEQGTKPEKVLVLIDERNPLDTSAYQIHILQKSNVADDKLTILDHDNPNPVMTNEEIIDLTYQSMKADAHFKQLFGRDDPEFSLDIEFKVDAEDTGRRQVYLKQARPFID